MMNRFHSLAIGTMLIVALAASAQQASTASVGPDNNHGRGNAEAGVPSVEQQLKVLTGKLDLTSDQQAKFTTILQQLHDATVKLMQDSSLTNEERLEKIRPQRYKARDEMRAVLNDDQKQKLDEYLQGPHNEMHGNLTGNTSRSQ
jgi:Spy/CpxP family protein refolding chaperone